MVITMQEEGTRFNARVGAIIYNEDKTKILIENQYDKRYMFPGGRIDVHEDSKTSIERELIEELNLKANLNLKYIVEMFIKSPKTKYHEIGFYFITKINENLIENNFKSLDGDSYFIWVPIKDLDKYNMLAKPIQDKVVNNEITNNNLEHLVYREY
ncbi:uncharacterized protein BN793_01200 [Firmicutes bacterium CAG:822]|nr:uncharacterized protein BN793_01200 [Firmicutes bacterium CAG:822]